ncbi:MAG: hypothetical protein IT449_10375 [Phycisphaerales bacterium]|nr:hypothetical protein [Phycisphaerales bacterium]
MFTLRSRRACRFILGRPAWIGRALGAVALLTVGAFPALAQDVVRPGADGTLADGLPYGQFDGTADDWDWTFNESGYEGAITLTCEREESCLETRVVWEYDLTRIRSIPPLQAGLTFTLRGPSIFPFPDSIVHVYAYPADGREATTDYSAGPVTYLGYVRLEAYEDPREHTLNVSAIANEVVQFGNDRLALRFQIDPDTAEDRQQAFIDALDSESGSKPYLTLDEAMPGDSDRDGGIDLADFTDLHDCLTGPAASTIDLACLPFDFDGDSDIDLQDIAAFQTAFDGP